MKNALRFIFIGLVTFVLSPIVIDLILLRWEAPWLWSDATWYKIGGVSVFFAAVILLTNDCRPSRHRRVYRDIAAILMGVGIGIVYDLILDEFNF